MLVHAHPDDETIFTGATMARYAAEGAHVTLVTCTAGEEGEILTPDIAHLSAEEQDELGPHRVEELAGAMRELGVTDHRYLGGTFRYRDSGMQWGPDGHAMPRDATRDDTFWRADLTEAADHLVAFDRGGAATLATRLPVGLEARGGWGDTVVLLPQRPVVDELTGREFEGGELLVADLLSRYPVALLSS